jgi:hypothetical protein
MGTGVASVVESWEAAGRGPSTSTSTSIPRLMRSPGDNEGRLAEATDEVRPSSLLLVCGRDRLYDRDGLC